MQSCIGYEANRETDPSTWPPYCVPLLPETLSAMREMTTERAGQSRPFPFTPRPLKAHVQLDRGREQFEKGAAMDTIRAAGLAACALGISFWNDAHAAIETDGGLLTSVAPPPNSRPLNRQSLSTGGEQATYMTTATPAGAISFYRQISGRGVDGDRQR